MRQRCPRHSQSQALAEWACAQRGAPSPAEARLWESIRAGKLGFAVKRQVVIGKSIADFVVPACSLVIEVDGRHHERRRAADARRDRKLAQLGYRVLRIEAELVHHALEEAVARIVAALEQG